MPKMKTKKALKGRFKVTATGKVMRMKGGKRHLLSSKSAKRRRHLRRPTTVTNKIAENYKALLAPGL